MTPSDLRVARLALGLTQKGLAERLGVTPTQVARWERGESGWAPYLELAMERLVERPA